MDLLWSLFAMPFSVVRENNKATMLGRILCFIFRLVHFSLSTATMTLAFALLDLPLPILRPLTFGAMMTKHLTRVAVIWTLAIAVSSPRFIYQNLYLISLEENLWMPHLPDILDSDWLVMKLLKIVISSVYFLVPLLLSAKAFLIMIRVQLLTIAAEMQFLELEDVVPPVPNRRKTLMLLLVLVVVFVMSSFPLSFYVALIASADAKTKSAVSFACQWFALINQHNVQFVHCGVENFENNIRLLVSEGHVSPKLLPIFWFLSLGLNCNSPAFLCSLITRPDVEELAWSDIFPSCATLRPCESPYCRLFNWTLELIPCSDTGSSDQ
uniref:Probable G-protein coupled receptor 83 isoform X2 n=1 Tax=Phascolarctos cinereus TaxID=38626 RepID=A0A6P5ILB7_PHACI|nr:probable G-protein coupled receptor 83 isoform X2 [Phascolarctos cinereus]